MYTKKKMLFSLKISYQYHPLFTELKQYNKLHTFLTERALRLIDYFPECY